MRYLPHYGNKKLTFMFDYCSSCLWDGPMIDYEDIRLSKRTEHFIDTWYNKMNDFQDSQNFKYDVDFTSDIRYQKYITINSKLRKLTKEQYKIARMIKRQYPKKKILVFDEIKYYLNYKKSKVEI